MLYAERQLVQTTWAQVAGKAPTVAALFYARLFELDPSLRPMFAHADMREQGRKLTTMLAVAVKSLDRLHDLIPAVEALGRRHAGSGVRDEHYATVGRALLDTLARGLGADFTPEVRAAWSTTYDTLAGVMRRAAEQAPAPRDAAAAARRPMVA
jgi:hemoglobin-like flavoprotein